MPAQAGIFICISIEESRLCGLQDVGCGITLSKIEKDEPIARLFCP